MSITMTDVAEQKKTYGNAMHQPYFNFIPFIIDLALAVSVDTYDLILYKVNFCIRPSKF